jgi:2-succinyl-5-enolpyruvyl-6-hydroxy-3-cyclohexene-1-carboxylate synthase
MKYTDEKNTQIVIALLKKHGIRKVVASPGGTNVNFVGSIQNDPFFEVYSSVDERSAAYLACGLAEESGESVVINCTGATASRNFMPGLTEAFYRKLPVLAITSSQIYCNMGHLSAQMLDRTVMPNDVAKLSVALPVVKDDADLWECEVKTNQAILELRRHGGGPVHINLPTTYNKSFATEQLPDVRVINRITLADQFPELPEEKVAIFLGSHRAMSEKEVNAIDSFCANCDAVVFCDHTSGYNGKYAVRFALVACQTSFDVAPFRPDLSIHIGEITGDYYSLRMIGRKVWRVNPDGEIRDLHKKMRYVFEMSESFFFEHYSKGNDAKPADTYLDSCRRELIRMRTNIPELPFSNPWIASKTAHRIPENSVVHLGILNSLRSWNFFDFPASVTSACNVGGFGIDGNTSSLLGASLVHKDRLYFGVIGDLSAFYDLNALGNRHLDRNLRILLVNNGHGTEFCINKLSSQFGNGIDEYISARGHFGDQSPEVMKQFSQALGFEYMSASSKEEFEQVCERFIVPKLTDRPMLFEVFTTGEDEKKAIEQMLDFGVNFSGKLKKLAKGALSNSSMQTVKSKLNL